MKNNTFLPVSKVDMINRGWDEVDFVYVSGDAYVDHPSFGVSIITRVLENAGYKVGVISQPDWRKNDSFKVFGKPRLGFMVSSGNIDSMVAHYTVAKRKRSTDAYSPGGKMGLRPDRAVIVYCQKIREIYGDIPIIIGGLEASLRRFAHYDYWDDAIRPSILFDSGADLISFGMGEKQTVEIANRLNNGENIKSLTDIKGTCYAVPVTETPYKGVECPSFENVLASKKEYAISCRIQQDEQDHIRGKVIKQRHGKMMLVQNEPMEPLTTEAAECRLLRTWLENTGQIFHCLFSHCRLRIFLRLPNLRTVPTPMARHRRASPACSHSRCLFYWYWRRSMRPGRRCYQR